MVIYQKSICQYYSEGAIYKRFDVIFAWFKL